jgi:hypothetical protein
VSRAFLELSNHILLIPEPATHGFSLPASCGRRLTHPASIIKSMAMGLTFITTPPGIRRPSCHRENQSKLFYKKMPMGQHLSPA